MAMLTPGMLLRSPAFSLACLIFAWKRKGNACYTGYGISVMLDASSHTIREGPQKNEKKGQLKLI